MNFKESYINSLNKIDFSNDFQKRVFQSLTENENIKHQPGKYLRRASVSLGFCCIILMCLCIGYFHSNNMSSDYMIAGYDIQCYKDTAFCISEGDTLFYCDSNLTEEEKDSIISIYIYCYETDTIQLEISGWRNLRYTASADGTYSFFAVTDNNEVINLDQDVRVLTEVTEESEDEIIFLE